MALSRQLGRNGTPGPFRALFDATSDVVFTVDADHQVTSWNPAFERLLGARNETSFPLSDILPSKFRRSIIERIHDCPEDGRVEVALIGHGAACVRLDLAIHRIPSDDGRTALLAVGRDITAEFASERMDAARQSVETMLALEAPLDHVLERLTELMDGHFSGAVSAISRNEQGSLQYVAGGLSENLRRALAQTRVAPMNATAGTAAYLQRPVVAGDIATDPTWITLGAAPLQDGFHSCWSAPVIGNGGAILGTFDIYFRRRLEPTHDRLELLSTAAAVVAGAIQHHTRTQEIHHRATHDVVTQLPNRYALEERMTELVARNPEMRLALLCVEVGNLKLVNETLGQRMGDKFLRAIGFLLASCLSSGEMVSRISDGQFIVLIADPGFAAPIVRAREIREELTAPVFVSGRELFAETSIGISLYPDHGCEPECLVSHAMTAVAHGKSQGGPRITSFAPAILDGISHRLDLRNELHRALRREEFSLHFQPQFNLRTGNLVGQEALLRWQTRRGDVSPCDFIPIAEESGLIVPLGDWALEQACRYAAQQKTIGRAVRCAVNISALQLAQADFVDRIEEILTTTGLPPGLLELELTETALMRDLETAAERMLALRLMGISLSVDDFGAGYSSLNRLRQLPLDGLKIDLSFVREIVDSVVPPTVQAIVALGRGLGMNVIAEGVETRAQLRVLQSIGCDEAQGFLLGRPEPADAPLRRPTLFDAAGISPGDLSWNSPALPRP